MSTKEPNTDTGNNTKKPVACFLLLLPVMILSILAVSGFIAIDAIKHRVVQIYGQPVSNLSILQENLYSLRLFFQQNSLISPKSIRLEKTTAEFLIEMGEPTRSIAERLEMEGFIPSANAFITYLAYSGLDSSIQAGEYILDDGLSPIQIAIQLQDATPGEIKFRLIAGWRKEEIAEALVIYGLLEDPELFLQAAEEPGNLPIQELWREGNGLEGLFSPGEYNIPRDASPEEMLTLFVERFDFEISDELESNLMSRGLTLIEAITLASIVEKEAVRVEEQKLIASVFYNRLGIGMKLQSDPTVQYSLGYIHDQKSWWKNPLYLNDLKIESPYNTYLNHGLPPGPICNPGLQALKAVADPLESNYFFFRARCDGSGFHNFSVTFEEHLKNACD